MTTSTTTLRAKIEQLEAKVEQLEAEAKEASNRYLRLAADFDNYKKRVRQEQSELVSRANEDLIARLLPVIDNFHRVLDSAPENVDPAWLKGVLLTLQQMDELLASWGVEPIQAVGQPFDPSLHEAIGHEESDDHPEDTVISEVRKGYRLRDRVVRPALVRVARPVGG
jgi:molecular chaperone GrpE